MAFWILDQWDDGPLDYPTLGFVADPDDILEASAAPDGRWSTTGFGPETVTRYNLGSDPSYVEPGDGHLLAWSDASNAYLPASLTATIEAVVLAAFESQTSGTELGYIERSTVYTTTNITAGNAAGDITALTFSFTGNGRPVDLEFIAPNTSHSVAGASIAAVIVVDGNLTGTKNTTGLVVSPATLASAGGPILFARRRVTTVADQVYSVKVNIRGSVAGTVTLGAATYSPITLSVVSR